MKRVQVLEDGTVPTKEARNWRIGKELQDRGALPSEDGDFVRKYNAMHEETILSSWLMEDDESTREEENRSGKREVERGGESGGQKKVCVCVSVLLGLFWVFCLGGVVGGLGVHCGCSSGGSYGSSVCVCLRGRLGCLFLLCR